MREEVRESPSGSPFVLGIVGHGAEKFTPETEALARHAIRLAIRDFSATKVVSGASPMGGIDRWAIEEAEALGIETQEFPPAVHQWDGTKDKPGFKQRNMQIAEASNIVLSFVVAEYPPGYTGRRFKVCYHHSDEPATQNHVKSGGCWTAKYARSIGGAGMTVCLNC